MPSTCFRFDDFLLDADDRRLERGGQRLDVSGRYLDALSLLVRDAGRLVSKDRFMDEVWRGIPVTDEALTQCIRSLRRLLGDDAARPRFIETVPKHGYRFIGQVEAVEGDLPSGDAPSRTRGVERWGNAGLVALAGTVGAGGAGILGGLFYGLAGASEPLAPGVGAISILLVLVWLTLLLALVGGAGVAFGASLAQTAGRRSLPWCVGGGALGGLIVGAVVKLVGLDAFNLLLGRSPGDITGALEGALLGGSLGLALWLGRNAAGAASPRRSLVTGGVAGAAAGMLITILGGRLLGGSLELLAAQFPSSSLRLDQIGALFGESGFGPFSHVVTGALEGALFGAGLVGAMAFAEQRLATRDAR